MDKKILEYNKMKYVFMLPDGYEEGKKYPVIILLHGAGSRGETGKGLLTNPYVNETDKLDNFGFISVLPQCPLEKTWYDVLEQLTDLIEHIYNSDFTDRKHFYCMGASMGGYATWEMAMNRPELFAAVVPICGGGMYWNAGRMASVPAWAFHGAKDNVVFPVESEKMVNALNAAGGNAKLTIYPENDHNAWSDTYRNPETYSWLLSNEKKDGDKTAADTTYTDSEIYG